MQLERLAGFAGKHRAVVIGIWVLLLAIAIPFAGKQTDRLFGGGSEAPGTPSAQLRQLHEQYFPRHELAVLVKFSGEASSEQRAATLKRVEQAVQKQPSVQPQRPRKTNSKSIVVVPISTKSSPHKLVKVAGALRAQLHSGKSRAGTTIYVFGEGAYWNALDEESSKQLKKAEAIGFPIVLIILLLAFGTLTSALLPLILGVVAVTITGAEIYFLSGVVDMSLYVKNVASMIGIGVAIDYSLFIVARFREELAEGKSQEEARKRALATSGKAVIFSGLAVVLSVSTIFLIDNQALRSMALGAILVVTTAVLCAITLLPALIAVFGKRVSGRKQVQTSRFWTRWATAVMRRPWPIFLTTTAALIVIALPALSMQTGISPINLLPKDSDVHIGLTQAAKNDPTVAGGIDVITPSENVSVVRKTVIDVTDPVFTSTSQGSGDRVLIHAVLKEPVDSQEAKVAVHRLRSAMHGDSSTVVGGESARIHDVSDQIQDSMPQLVVAMLILAFLILALLLRSIVLPLKAILLNLLSIGVAFGVLVAVFQWGWFDGLFGFESLGRINSITPPLVLTVVFGLSMDYEVFLLDRIRERFKKNSDNTAAVAGGLASSARTITSAALIMIGVFLVFVGTGVQTVQEIGLGCAVAIAVDATLVRLLLVPATMKLLGKWNWWWPFEERSALGGNNPAAE